MTNITDTNPFKAILNKDENAREINLYKLYNVSPTNDTFYPNCMFYNKFDIFNPSSEKIMSLQTNEKTDIVIDRNIEYSNVINNPVFFFIYNTDNYYHFIYDTLPYLISYFELKKEIPELKLLMNYPNNNKKTFYKFVTEFLDLLGITNDDILIINESALYRHVYISSSYTHGIDSNLPPRKEIYDFYLQIVDIAKSKSNIDVSSLPKKIYISRRTWIHGDMSNIGTNYTTRRKLECEDELVELLKKQKIEEIFTENLSTIEKIILFNNAELVVGAIGGGLCNVLFGSDKLNLLCIVSPTFLEVNYRFKYCFDKVKCFYFDETFHTEEGLWKKWMRVKYEDIIGEIEEVKEEYLNVAYTDTKVAGWNSELKLKKMKMKKDLCTPLDKGLNSSWSFHLQNFYLKFFGETPDDFKHKRKNSIKNK